MKEKEISDFVIDFVKGRGSTLGCQLGAELHIKFPETNIRSAYGGVRRFIDSYCRGAVARTGAKGGDDVYSHVSAPAGESAPAKLPQPGRVTEWDVFQRPGNPMQLLIDPTSGIARIAPETGEVANGLRVVPKVTGAEHLSIAKDFLQQISSTDLPPFAAALGENNYWPKWNQLMNAMPGIHYRSAWTAFRFDRICDLFSARLKELGISDVAARSVLEHLKSEKRMKRAAKGAGRSISPTAGTTYSLSDDDLRRIAKLAIDAMGIDDLRRVWLPLGVIVDAFTTR